MKRKTPSKREKLEELHAHWQGMLDRAEAAQRRADAAVKEAESRIQRLRYDLAVLANEEAGR